MPKTKRTHKTTKKITTKLKHPKAVKTYGTILVILFLSALLGLLLVRQATAPTTNPSTLVPQPTSIIPSTSITTSQKKLVVPTNVTNTPSTPPVTAAPTTYSISGYIYKDENNNGSRDSGEMIISGANIYFLSLGKSTVSDTTGRYSMDGLAPGTYNITANTQNGMSSAGENPAFVTITSGNANQDFGFH